MFTGIIEELGSIKSIVKTGKSAKITVECQHILEDIHLGDSISTNGVCLTASQVNPHNFVADVMLETLSRSNLGSLKVGSAVNLERAMSANGRFGGHMVSGHIDGTGKISAIKQEEIAWIYSIKAEKNLLRYIVEKGSIAIDGISLTVTKVDNLSFSVSIIPHTAKSTILSKKKIGDTVNLETDIVGKYIEKFLTEPKGITQEMLDKFTT